MKAMGTFFRNDADQPLAYGEADRINPPRIDPDR